VDIRGFANIYPPAFYSILTEALAASIICAGFVLVDFWLVCATPMGKQSGVKHKYKVVAIVYLNFIGLQALGVIDAANFVVYDFAKSFIAAGILIAYQVIAYFPIRKIWVALSTSAVAQAGDKVQKPASSNKSSAIDDKRQRMIRKLNRKILAFYVLTTLGWINYLVIGVITLSSRDPVNGNRWKITCDIGIGTTLSKTVQIIACVLSFAFFAIPRRKEESTRPSDQNNNGPSTGTNRDTALVPASSLMSAENTGFNRPDARVVSAEDEGGGA